MSQSPPIRQIEIARFWAPMALTWLMMAIEGPFLAAVIARLDDPKHNLAAFGVAFAFAIIVEAPVIMILSASTKLVTGAGSYRRLLRFTSLLNAAVTLGLLLFVATPLFDLVARRGIGLDAGLAATTRQALLVMLPWPAAIGWRRFYQGLLIRGGSTRRIAWTTATRLLAMATTGGLLATRTELPGAIVGCAALACGVSFEAFVTYAMTRPVARALRATPDQDLPAASSYRGIAAFYYPLALTSTVSLAVQPLTTFFMGQARMPLESLAVLPVVNALSFIFRAAGLSFQEVAIALLDRDPKNRGPVTRFALMLACVSSGLLAAIAFTPLADVWFRDISGLSVELADFARVPTCIASLVPFVSVVLSFQRSLLVHAQRTRPIGQAAGVEVGATAAVLALAIFAFDLVGAIAATIAMLAGRVAGALTLTRAVGFGAGRRAEDFRG